MIKLNSVKFKNFLSFGNKMTDFDVSDKGIRLILGQNEDVGDSGTSSNGSGKCLGKDTPVMMSDGSIKMVQDVKVGDTLMGDDGSPRNVLSTTHGRSELFEVKQNIGMSYVVNKDHVLSLKVGTTRKKYGHTKGEIVNVSVEDYLAYPGWVKRGVCGYIGDLKEFGEKNDNLFHPWLIGLWLADGTSSKPDITFNKDDVELIEEVDKIRISEGYKTNVCPSADRDGCIGISYPGGFLKKLREINVLNNKHVPEEYKNADYDSRLEVLAGIIDGDGYKDPKKHHIDLCMKDTPLIDDIVFLCRSVGLRVHVADKFSKCAGFDGDIYKRISITGDLEKIPNRLSRKKTPPKKETSKPRHFGVTGINVTPIGVGDYYGFELDGNHLFCLGDGTVTHNSSIMNAILFGLYGKGIDKMKNDDFINVKNKKGMEVHLSFSKHGKDYLIIRGRKPNKLEFYSGKDSLTLDSMSNTQEVIQKVIGVDYDVFITTFFLSPHKESFMAMSGADQRNIMESILSLDTLSERAEAIKQMKKDLDIDLKLLDKDVDHAEKTNQMVDSMISSIESRKKDEQRKHDDRIQGAKKELSGLKDIDTDELKEAVEFVESSQNKIDEKKEELNKVSLELSKVNNDTQNISRQIETFKKKEVSIEETREALKDHEGIDYDEQLQLSKSKEEDQKLYDQLQGEIDRIHEQNLRLEKEAKTKQKDLDEFEAGVCPTCGQEHEFEKAKIESLKEEIEQHRENYRQNNEAVKEKTGKQQELATALSERGDLLSERDILDLKNHRDRMQSRLDDLLGEEGNVDLKALEKELKTLKASHEKLEITQSKLQEEIQELMKEKDDIQSILNDFNIRSINDVDNIEKRIKDLKETIDQTLDLSSYDEQIDEQKSNRVNVEELSQKKKDVEERIEHCGYLVKLLTDSKSFIRKNIVNQYIPFLNKKLVEYCEYLGLRHVPSINADLTTTVEYLGSSVSYFNLSQGERLRLNMSLTVAFRELLSMLGKDMNVMFLDEHLDGASDAFFIQKALSFIHQKIPNILMISHREEVKEYIDTHILIKKQNGFSTISTA